MPALELYQVGFLKKGPAWTATQTDETRQIQSAHMAHINKMADSGKLVAAGPVLDTVIYAGFSYSKYHQLKKLKP